MVPSFNAQRRSIIMLNAVRYIELYSVLCPCYLLC